MRMLMRRPLNFIVAVSIAAFLFFVYLILGTITSVVYSASAIFIVTAIALLVFILIDRMRNPVVLVRTRAINTSKVPQTFERPESDAIRVAHVNNEINV